MPVQSMPLRKNTQDLSTVALLKSGRYSLGVTANSVTGFDGPTNSRRTGAPITIAGAFFVPAHPVYGGCAQDTFGCAGFLDSRSVNLRTAATLIRLTASRGSSQIKELRHMHALNPFKNRAAAHRAMALAALHANSSLATRLARYNAHMSKARALESAGGVQ